jgi:hypothetical protein
MDENKEILIIKHKLSEMLKIQIEVQKGKLQVLRTMQSQVEAATNSDELKKIHDDLAEMLGIPNPNK